MFAVVGRRVSATKPVEVHEPLDRMRTIGTGIAVLDSSGRRDGPRGIQDEVRGRRFVGRSVQVVLRGRGDPDVGSDLVG